MDALGQPTEQQVKYKRFGRPFGSTNYGGGISMVAQQFKREGYDWRHELVSSYAQYKSAHDAWLADPVRNKPDADLLNFWIRLMPYISQTVSEKDAHKRQRNVQQTKRYKVTKSAIAKLAEAEGRPNAV